jgi:ABC-2 type transport system permease protein
MGKLGVVFQREYLERVRSKWFLIGTLLGPVFFGMITFLPIWLSVRQKPAEDLAHVIVLDATGTGLGARVANGLKASFPKSPQPMLKLVAPERLMIAEDSAVRSVMTKEVQGFIVLDSNTVANRSVRYAGRNAGSMGDVQALMTSLKQQVLAQRLEREGLDPVRVTALTAEKLETTTEKISDTGRERGSGTGNLMFGWIIAFLLYMMIMIYGQQILRGVMDEKTNRVAEVVLSSVSPDTLLAGKVLGIGLVAVTQVLAWVALSAVMVVYVAPLVLGGAPVGGAASGGVSMSAITASLPSLGAACVMLAYFALGYIFYASLFAAVGAMVSSQEDVQQASMPVMLLLISTVIFMQPILLNPGSALSRTMSILPFSAPILMPLRMSLVPVPWYELAASLGGVVVAGLAAIWVSARIYRVGLLMYGKRPTYGELAKWIRQAG